MYASLHRLNTQTDILNHLKKLFQNIESDEKFTQPPLSMLNPVSWKIIQAHQNQQKIGWKAFFNGLISKRWTEIQKAHYDSEPKNGENIHRWKRLVIQEFLELLREMWTTRCGYIHAEKIMTAKEMLSHRTLVLFNETKHKRDLVSVLDRHLFDKEESYFFKSSKEMLELWESKIKTALTNIDEREKGQQRLVFYPNPQIITANNKDALIAEEQTIARRLERLGERIEYAKRMRKKRRLTNADCVWNKRLRVTRMYLDKKKRQMSSLRRMNKKQRGHQENNNNSVRS